MEFIRSIRQKQQTAKQEAVQQKAEELITIADFESSLYIAYQGTPLIHIEDSWTSQQIVKELLKVRQNYINAHCNNNNYIEPC